MTTPAMSHRQAMRLAATEYQRLIDAVDALSTDDWSRPTANDLWDVKALLGHVLGMMEANASVREMVRQQRAAAKRAKQSGAFLIDEVTKLQVLKHADRTPADVARDLRRVAPKAVKGRSRTPAPVRAVRMKQGPPFDEKWTVGYMLDVIITRDVWMHRSDIADATGVPMALTPEHDGRIVADVVAEWARRHARPFTLLLSGPAGGAFGHGDSAEPLELDAVEFCRILSGRGTGSGLLTQGVPF